MKNVKILSVLFALVMLFSFVCVSVLADEPAAETTAAETTAAEETVEPEETAEADESEEEEGLRAQPMNFIYNLKYMGVGMFCIIVVIVVLIGVTMLLNKVTASKKE